MERVGFWKQADYHVLRRTAGLLNPKARLYYRINQLVGNKIIYKMDSIHSTLRERVYLVMFKV
jgi:hypothetical protein